MNMKIQWTSIHDVVQETGEVKTFFLDIPKDFTWVEGSFTHLALEGFKKGGKPNRDLVRHMSICTLPEEGKIGITTKIKEKRSLYKDILEHINVGEKVALFKTVSHVPLRRENQNIYLLSQGVGIATFRPLVLKYFEDRSNVKKIYSLNVDSSNEFLFTDVFQTDEAKNFTAQFVNNRKDYYEQVRQLANDDDGIYYVVGSDEFLKQTIETLTNKGILRDQIMIDKREDQRDQFFPPFKQHVV